MKITKQSKIQALFNTKREKQTNRKTMTNSENSTI